MKFKQIIFFLFPLLVFSGASPLFGAKKPVTPNPSPEAVELLEYIYSISGKHTITGQHCAPLVGSTRLSVVHRMTKFYPALYGQDFGFSFPGYWDGINYRQRIVDEAIRRHNEGFVITLMWHAVRPTEQEPVTFRESIQGDLSDKEWQDLITPGTEINERWKSQVDVVAWFLQQLRDADVPVLWRPYHEMNGGWFWWGKKGGDSGYKKLWRMLYDRLVNFHRLNNLIWVFNTNEVKEGVDLHETYYPGHDVVDILATDVYTEGFNQMNYDQLLALAGKKPIALGEVGRIPTLEILKSQPRWTWFMSWGDPGNMWGDFKAVLETFGSKEALTLEELPWVELEQVKMHYPILK
ncbi:MAG: glycosyl hydrolase family 26 [Fidelibacterota bacterium]|nr:MAG: glycosyl hydrolase family 26 [Candidatus Neomarinimicrobiota bacterium]